MDWRSVIPEGLAGEFAPRLFRFFESLGADPATAEDLTQEVFLRLLRTKAPYEERGKISSYLFRTAYRIWIDETRTKRPRPDGGPSELPPKPDPAEGPFELCLRHEREDRLREGMRQLPPGQREAFELGVVQGILYQEVAEILGVPLGTVKSRVFAAASKLKELLREGAPPS